MSYLQWQESMRLAAGLILVQGFRLPIAIPRTWLDLRTHETRWCWTLKA